MTESEFVDLLSRFEKGQCTPREEELLRKWLDANDPAIVPFKNDAEKTKVLSALRTSVYRQAGLSEKVSHNPLTISWVMRVAASILVIVTIAFGLYRFYGIKPLTQQQFLKAEATNNIKKTHLPDGTIVWLKHYSTLTYPAAFTGQQRRVVLQGEALFEVEKDPQHPFVISCGDLTTTVLGTSFNIRSDNDNVEVIVLAGLVSLTPASAGNSIRLTKEEKGLYKKTLGTVKKTDALQEDTRRVTSGTEYNMYFEDTRMEELIPRIEQKFDVRIRAENSRLKNCLITADFTDLSLQKTLDIISSITPIKYQLDNNSIILTGDGCN